MGHHISNTYNHGALPDDKSNLREFDKAIAEFPEEETQSYRKRYGIVKHPFLSQPVVSDRLFYLYR